MVAVGAAECNHPAMAGLTLRLDEETHEWLRARADANGRSLNAELLDILAVARADELAATLTHPAAQSHRLARSLGVRTPRSARVLRAQRDARGR